MEPDGRDCRTIRERQEGGPEVSDIASMMQLRMFKACSPVMPSKGTAKSTVKSTALTKARAQDGRG